MVSLTSCSIQKIFSKAFTGGPWWRWEAAVQKEKNTVAQHGHEISPKFCQVWSPFWSPDSHTGNICTVLIITPPLLWIQTKHSGNNSTDNHKRTLKCGKMADYLGISRFLKVHLDEFCFLCHTSQTARQICLQPSTNNRHRESKTKQSEKHAPSGQNKRSPAETQQGDPCPVAAADWIAYRSESSTHISQPIPCPTLTGSSRHNLLTATVNPGLSTHTTPRIC